MDSRLTTIRGLRRLACRVVACGASGLGLASAVLIALSAPSCTAIADFPGPTSVSVHVCFGVAVPADVVFVRLVAESATRPVESQVLAAPPGVAFAQFTLFGSSDVAQEEDFFLSVEGLSDSGALRISRTVHTWFTPRVERDVALWLEPACLDVTCRAGETCGGGVCAPVTLTDEHGCPEEP
jgi:hypothetical protein